MQYYDLITSTCVRVIQTSIGCRLLRHAHIILRTNGAWCVGGPCLLAGCMMRSTYKVAVQCMVQAGLYNRLKRDTCIRTILIFLFRRGVLVDLLTLTCPSIENGARAPILEGITSQAGEMKNAHPTSATLSVCDSATNSCSPIPLPSLCGPWNDWTTNRRRDVNFQPKNHTFQTRRDEAQYFAVVDK